MSVAEFSIKRPVTTIMFFVSMVVIGLIASIRLPLEALPDISAPFMFIQLPYTGSTPEEVEHNLVRPVEEALATMPGIKRLRSVAAADSGQILVEFSDWDRDIAIAASDARERINAIRDDLPNDFRRYHVFKWSSSDQPILRVQLSSAVNLTDEYDMIEREFKRRLERIAGVAKVEISGAPPKEVEIAIDSDRLTAHGLSLNELTARLQLVNFSISAGEIEDHGLRLRVQPVGELRDLQQWRDLVILANGLRLGDVSEIRLKPTRMYYGRRLDGKPAVGLDVYKERSANLVQVSSAALKAIEVILQQPSLRDVQIKVIVNQGENVTSSLKELAEAGMVGLLLSVIVLYFFLRHWPSTLMVTLAIPICFIMTLGFMYFFGVTLNILTMMGLLLAVGMLVDNAVVVVESIYQEREKTPGRPLRASIIGTRNVAIALSAGTLCHCIVFVPNLFGEANQISIFMAQIAITISVSLLASWLVAVSLIPMLSAKMPTPPIVKSERGLIPRLQRRYAQLLGWSLAHRGWSVFGIIAIITISLLPMTKMKVDMFGGKGGKETYVIYQWNGSYTREQISEEVARVEGFLDRNRERFQITQIYSWYSEQGNSATIVTFDLANGAKLESLVESIRKDLPQSVRAQLVISSWVRGGSSGSQGQSAQVRLIGDSTQVLN
ncbi:MAG: efflux RND transporter permease subunit, partial [Xanthomonadaceae bacterium]|nr:efflux RND transporter permease subunit [Xanthomonadaceae bacterium]